jgi:protein required for attachment to host cells
MERKMAADPVWVVVADGVSARFFVRRRAGTPLAELDQLAMKAPPTDEMTDRPPRAHDSMGQARHAITRHDTPKQISEEKFLTSVAQRTNDAVLEHAVGRLVLMAPPRAMGTLRNNLSDAASKLVACEITKEATESPVASIDARVTEHGI